MEDRKRENSSVFLEIFRIINRKYVLNLLSFLYIIENPLNSVQPID